MKRIWTVEQDETIFSTDLKNIIQNNQTLIVRIQKFDFHNQNILLYKKLSKNFNTCNA